jgi:hypothetical protein
MLLVVNGTNYIALVATREPTHTIIEDVEIQIFRLPAAIFLDFANVFTWRYNIRMLWFFKSKNAISRWLNMFCFLPSEIDHWEWD